MDEFSTLARDYGFRPQGKAAPMKSGLGSDGGDRRHWSSSTTSSPLFDDKKSDIFNDVYGGPPKYSSTSSKPSSTYDFQYDSRYQNSAANESKSKVSSSSGPIYDKPVFDDDILDGLPGLKSKPMSSSARYDDTENIFASMGSSPAQKSGNYDDLLGGFGGKEKMEAKSSKGQKDFDDLLPGFGSSSSPSASNRPSSASSKPTKSASNSSQTASSTVTDDPFVASPSGVFIDPLEDLNKFNTSSNTKTDASVSGGLFDDIDPLNSFGSNTKEQPRKSSSKHHENKSQKKPPYDDDLQQDSHQQPIFDIPAVSESHKSNLNPKNEEKVQPQQPPADIWLTVSEIPLFTQPTRARPPSRPPPPVPGKRHARRHIEFTHSPRPVRSTPKTPVAPQETEKDYDNDEQEEEERECMRLEKERERVKEIEREREREKARQAVERANREARDRAAMEARRKVERAAVQRAQAEARERAAAEARERAERAAAEARERADKANAEARERESRRKAERAAAERAAAEARERAAAEAQERAAAHARMNQQKPDDDLESFFSMSSKPSTAAKPRANFSDSAPEQQFQSRADANKTSSSSGVSSNMKKASSTTNIFDDLTSILGNGASSAGEFQDIEGETEERRRARLERHQRTQERAAKALAEKNQRDLQTQREQEERHRAAETLDFEIKRWSAGKEGNLRSLLSTLQYVLWPECGWQPVSLTDLMTGASVKKAYRKATLCIHPDKVQQKGSTLQQKYVAEKVFDLLKEAWNKFNSEELF
jgi:hypothetical protein